MASTTDQVILFRGELPGRRETEKLVVIAGTQRGEPFIDVRIFFKADDGQWLPTKKGVNLHAEFGHDFSEMIRKGIEAIDNAH